MAIEESSTQRTGGYLGGTDSEWRERYEREYDIVARVWAAVKNGAGYPGEELSRIVSDYVNRAESAEAENARLLQALDKVGEQLGVGPYPRESR